MSSNNPNTANVTTTVTTKSSQWLVWTPVISDLLIVICLSAWCIVSTKEYNYWKDECVTRYDYSAYSDEDVICSIIAKCDEDLNCRVDPNLHWISGSLDTGTDCPGFECGDGECTCEIAGTWEGLYICYMILFSFSALVEAFKALLVISAVMSRGCDPTENQPIETTSLQTCMDSWILILLRIGYPKRYEQLVQANNEGKVPVITKTKLAQWAYRDFSCGLIITLYPLKVHFLNGWQIPTIVGIVVYALSLWRRSEWVDSQKSKMQMLTQSPIVAMVEIHHQQQVESQPHTTNGAVEGS